MIVAGLGAVGSAACAQLAQRGVSVLGIDRYEPPHPFGSTHGDTRITRLATGEGPEYVPLVQRSQVLWRTLEQETGVDLLRQVGGLTLGHPDGPVFRATTAVAEEFGIPHERLSAADLQDRFPAFTVDGETEGYFEPAAGYLRPEAAVAAHLTVARRAGAQLRFDEVVSGLAASDRGVVVTTNAGRYETDRLVLSVGAWLPGLVPQVSDLLSVYRQVLYWFEIVSDYGRSSDLPVWMWEFAGTRDEMTHFTGFYGFPALDGPSGGLKLATESYARTTVPDGRQHVASADEVAMMHRDYVAPRLPWLGPRSVRTASCLYTSAPHSRFLIDQHPEHESVLIVSACSGHGFKHSPAVGEAAAAWAVGEPPAPGIDLTPFRFAAHQRLH